MMGAECLVRASLSDVGLADAAARARHAPYEEQSAGYPAFIKVAAMADCGSPALVGGIGVIGQLP